MPQGQHIEQGPMGSGLYGGHKVYACEVFLIFYDSTIFAIYALKMHGCNWDIVVEGPEGVSIEYKSFSV